MIDWLYTAWMFGVLGLIGALGLAVEVIGEIRELRLTNDQILKS
jgi:hypothetical protein